LNKRLKPFRAHAYKRTFHQHFLGGTHCASRTKSVRERPRRSAARSMMAMSPSGSRIDSG
jgi:hypothetical protein